MSHMDPEFKLCCVDDWRRLISLIAELKQKSVRGHSKSTFLDYSYFGVILGVKNFDVKQREQRGQINKERNNNTCATKKNITVFTSRVSLILGL